MKKLFIILIIMIFTMPTAFCTNINLSDFSNEMKNYSNEFFPELGDESFITSVMCGDVNASENLFQKITDIF